MNAPLSSILSAAIAIALITMNAVGAGTVRGATGATASPSAVPSPTHGTMVWDGTVKDNAIEATRIWTRERWYWKIKKEYWYRGQLKNENRGE